MFRFISSVLVVICFFFSEKLYAQPGFAVVELFTSQGDINSPAADKILSDFVAEASPGGKNIYCISQHVDFWNRFGWKDPFSSLRYTHRLHNYSSASKDTETYTPYFVVNGTAVDANQVREKVKAALEIQPSLSLSFSYQIFDDTLDLSYRIDDKSGIRRKWTNYYVHAVIVEKGLDTKVTAGDNKGKVLRNDNVARLFYTATLLQGTGMVRVPLKKNR